MRNAWVMAGAVVMALMALSAFGGKDEVSMADVEIVTARGVALKASIHRPAKPNGTAVVVAPGQNYHRELPVVKRSAECLSDAGFVALRFDWAYYTAKGHPSADLATEVADLDAAIAYAKKQDGVVRVLLAGKSLGSVVALQWSNAHPDALEGLALLTFPITDPTAPGETQPCGEALTKSRMAPLIVCGNEDPNADLATLYSVAAKVEKTPQVVIVPGDHGYLSDGDKSSPDSAENVELAVKHLVVWAKRRVAR